MQFYQTPPWFKSKSYNDRLKICGLESLEYHWVHNDLIFVYKILNGLVLVNFENDFNMCRRNVSKRGNIYKLEKQRFYLDIGKYFVTCRTVNV